MPARALCILKMPCKFCTAVNERNWYKSAQLEKLALTRGGPNYSLQIQVSFVRTDAPMLRSSRDIRYHRLDVGLHDCPDPCLLPILPEFIGRTLVPPDTFAQSFHCDIQADLVAISEAVYDSSCWIRH